MLNWRNWKQKERIHKIEKYYREQKMQKLIGIEIYIKLGSQNRKWRERKIKYLKTKKFEKVERI